MFNFSNSKHWLPGFAGIRAGDKTAEKEKIKSTKKTNSQSF